MTNELAGFASLPADTFADGPDAGGDDGEGNPIDANGRTGPFDGQPVQGFSGVQFAPDNTGAFWFLSDNGFGSQENSTDYLLRIYQADPNFTGAENGDGSIEIQDFIQLSDPDNLIPFDIVNQDSEDRLLTGGDFDVESFVIDDNGDIWVGEEFGPFLLHFNSDGELIEAPIATPNITSLDTLNGQAPLVIGHRGASGLLPEHTLEAYRVAIAQGADFIEPDLVITKDGGLIARHEPILDNTTNVAEVFGEDRMSTKILDGEEVTAYFAEDFTLEEIKQLRAVQSRDFRSPEFDGAFEIPTLQEVIELVQETEAETGVQVGIYPETKHPTFFDEQGLSLEEPLVQTLIETGFTNPNRIFIQSFEVSNLIELSATLEEADLGDIPLVQLFGNTEDDDINEGGGGFSVPFDFVANFGSKEFTQEDAVATYGEELLTALGIIGEDGSYNPEVGTSITYGAFANPEVIAIISSYFPATGVAVVDSITADFVLSPQNPDLGDALPNLASSRGFEGMAFSPDRSTLYPLLEGTVDGDPENALRIYEFDVESSSFTGLVGFYPTTDGNPISDFTPINDTEFLVIERDGEEGEAAEFKKIFKIDISEIDENGFVEKTEVVDLLNIADPNDLNADGETTYDMPFVTIEDVVVIDEDTILVANDNNYPFSMGREEDIDNNEVALIELDEPLDLDPSLGGTALTQENGNGAVGVDTLTGAEGEDTFILGDEETGAFYNSSGFDDYAEVSNFVSGEDDLQLAGSLEDYSILVNEGANVAIALDNDGDGAFDLAFDEFIALVGSGFETTDLGVGKCVMLLDLK